MNDLSRNISNYAHQIASLIPYSCSTNEYCQALTTSIVPSCEPLNGAAGCWCGNREAFYRCTACLSSATGSQTAPDGTQKATDSFKGFDEACQVYEQLIKSSTISIMGQQVQTPAASVPVASATVRSTQGGVPGESSEKTKLPVGMIVGAVLGTVTVLLVIFGAVRFFAGSIRKNRSKQSSRKNYYYKSIRYSSERSMNGHRSRTVYKTPYECVAPPPVPDNTQLESGPTHVIGSVETPESNSPPPYRSSAHRPHSYQLDRKSRAV